MEPKTSETNSTTITNVVKKDLPNSNGTLVLGILSIVGCSCYGLIGIVMGIIALAISSKPKTMYAENPELYTESSYKNMNAGRICAIIGLCLSAPLLLIGLIYLIVAGAAIGTVFSTLPWENFF